MPEILNRETAISPFHYLYKPNTIKTLRDIEEALVGIQNNYFNHDNGFAHLKRLVAAYFVDYSEPKITPLVAEVLTAINIKQLTDAIYRFENAYIFDNIFTWLYDTIDALVSLSYYDSLYDHPQIERQEVKILASVGIVDSFGFLSEGVTISPYPSPK